MNIVNTIARITLGIVAALVVIVPMYYAFAWVLWMFSVVMALAATAGVGYLAATSGYDKLTDGCASLVNFVRSRKAVAA